MPTGLEIIDEIIAGRRTTPPKRRKTGLDIIDEIIAREAAQEVPPPPVEAPPPPPEPEPAPLPEAPAPEPTFFQSVPASWGEPEPPAPVPPPLIEPTPAAAPPGPMPVLSPTRWPGRLPTPAETVAAERALLPQPAPRASADVLSPAQPVAPSLGTAVPPSLVDDIAQARLGMVPEFDPASGIRTGRYVPSQRAEMFRLRRDIENAAEPVLRSPVTEAAMPMYEPITPETGRRLEAQALAQIEARRKGFVPARDLESAVTEIGGTPLNEIERFVARMRRAGAYAEQTNALANLGRYLARKTDQAFGVDLERFREPTEQLDPASLLEGVVGGGGRFLADVPLYGAGAKLGVEAARLALRPVATKWIELATAAGLTTEEAAIAVQQALGGSRVAQALLRGGTSPVAGYAAPSVRAGLHAAGGAGAVGVADVVGEAAKQLSEEGKITAPAEIAKRGALGAATGALGGALTGAMAPGALKLLADTGYWGLIAPLVQHGETPTMESLITAGVPAAILHLANKAAGAQRIEILPPGAARRGTPVSGTRLAREAPPTEPTGPVTPPSPVPPTPGATPSATPGGGILARFRQRRAVDDLSREALGAVDGRGRLTIPLDRARDILARGEALSGATAETDAKGEMDTALNDLAAAIQRAEPPVPAPAAGVAEAGGPAVPVPAVEEPTVQPPAPAEAPPPAPVRWFAWQAGYGRVPASPQWTLTEDIPGHPKGSTVGTRTLQEAGYTVPEPPEAAPEAKAVPPVAPAPEGPAEGEEEAPKAPVTGFTTSLGSTYVVDAEGRTTRTKAPHLGHPATDVGLKERSDRTVYVEPEAGREIADRLAVETEGVPVEAHPRAVIEGDEIVLTWGYGIGPDGQPYGKRARTTFSFTTVPEVGLSPVEFWLTGRGRKGVHPGTAITAISTEAVKPAEPAPPVAKPSAVFTLPSDLAGAKPRFGFRDRNYTLDFESDLDKALFTVAQTFKSRRDADYMAALRTVYPNSEEETIRDLGRAVRARIKALVAGLDDAEPVRIEPITQGPVPPAPRPAAGAPPPAPAAPPAPPPVPTAPARRRPQRPAEPEVFDPNDINQLARFVRARGRLAPSPSGDLAGEYADVPAHFKSRRGLSPDRMAEAIEEASGVSISDAELLDRLKRYRHLQAEQAAAAVARRDSEQKAGVLANLRDDELIRELATHMGISEEEAARLIDAGRRGTAEADSTRLILDAAARIEDERVGSLSDDDLAEAVAAQTGRDPGGGGVFGEIGTGVLAPRGAGDTDVAGEGAGRGAGPEVAVRRGARLPAVSEPADLGRGEAGVAEPAGRYARRANATQADIEGAQRALDFVAEAAAAPVSSARGALVRRTEPPVPRTVGFGVTPEAIAQELRNTGTIDFRGKIIDSAEAYAVAAQVLRNPLFETLRFHFTDDAGRIVHQESITSRLPDTGMAFMTEDPEAEIAAMWARAEALGATKAWMLHNHTTGDPVPSNADVRLTQRIAKAMPALQGHVVIDHRRYALISPDGAVEARALRPVTRDPLLTPSIPHALLGREVRTPDDIAQLGSALKVPEGWVAAFYVDTKHRVRGIQDIPAADLEGLKNAAAYLKAHTEAFGAPYAVLWTPERSARLAWLAPLLGRQGLLLDYVWGAAESMRSAQVEEGFRPGRPVPKAIRVEEQPGEYRPERPAPSALGEFFAEDPPPYTPAPGGGEADLRAEIDRIRSENAALRAARRGRRGQAAPQPQDSPEPTDPGPDAIRDHNARVEGLPAEVRSNAVIRDTLYGPSRFLGAAQHLFRLRARRARVAADAEVEAARHAARAALGPGADTLLIESRPRDYGFFDMFDRPSHGMRQFGPLADKLITTMNLAEIRMRIEYGERMHTEVHGLRQVPRADWGKRGAAFFDAFEGVPIADILADPSLAPETKTAMQGLRARMEADTLFIRDRKRAEATAWMSKQVERELRRAGFARPTAARRTPAQVAQLRAEVDRVTEERVRALIPDAYGIRDYLTHIFPGEFAIQARKPDGSWVFFDSARDRLGAIGRVVEAADATGRPLGDFRVTVRMFHDPDVVRVSNARHWKVIGDLAKSLAVTQDDVLAATRGTLGVRHRQEKWWGSLQHREGFEHYRKDLLFVLSLYHAGFTRWHWLTDLRRAVGPGIEQIRARGQEQLAKELEANLDVLWGHRATSTQLVDNAIDRLPVLRDFHVPGTLDRFMARTKGLTALLFLTTSPRFHAINRLQTFQTLWPLVTTPEFVWGRVLWGLGPFGGRVVLVDGDVYLPKRFGPNNPLPPGAEVLDGPAILKRHGVEHLAGGKFYGEGEIAGRLKRAVAERLPEAMKRRAPERFNQEVAFLTYYLKGRRAGMDDRAAADYAFIGGNLYSQFVGLRTDQPRMLGRTITGGGTAPVKSAVTQFKRFQIANLGIGWDLGKEALRGHPAGFGKWLLALAVLGGLKGLLNPILGLLGLATLGAGWLTMRAHDELAGETNPLIADLVMYGLPELLGVDLSYSMQLLDAPLAPTIPSAIGEVLLGPMGALLAGGIGAMRDDKPRGYIASPWERGARSIAQRASGLRAIQAASQLARDEPMIRDPAGRARFRANFGDMLRYAAGFRTMTQAEQDRILSAYLDVVTHRDRVMERATLEIVGLGDKPTEAEVSAAWGRAGARVERWNALFPEGYFFITADDLRQRAAARESTRDQDILERAVRHAPKSLRDYFGGRAAGRSRGAPAVAAP